MPTSQNGWSASEDRDAIGIETFRVPGTDLLIPLRRTAAPVLLWMMAYWDDNIEDIEQGGLDDWGFAFRPIRGQTTMLSNHSSGTAVDVNARKYPRSTSNMTLEKRRKVRAMVAMVNRAAGMTLVRWGGEWTGTNRDEMHLELAPGSTAADVRRAMDNLRPKPAISFHRARVAFEGPNHASAPLAVARIQQRLVDKGFLTGFYVKGVAGGKTRKALAAYAERHGFIADGLLRRPLLEKLAGTVYRVID